MKEGRLDTNNVTRSASMYYLKTIYTILISIIIIFLNIPYPFIPFQMTLLDNFVAGFPSFMILFERNIERQKESIGRHALLFAPECAGHLTVLWCACWACSCSYETEMFTILYFSASLISIHDLSHLLSSTGTAASSSFSISSALSGVLLFWDWLELAAMDQRLALCIVAIVCRHPAGEHRPSAQPPSGPYGTVWTRRRCGRIRSCGRRILKTILRRFQRERVGS
ncbi:MAG: hypothetical protein ACLVJ6_05780 [Merdibacter sp.]